MISFDTSPEKYVHWDLEVSGDTAFLGLNVREDHPIRPGYTLKLNSYDLGVDIELFDAVERLRFEHPEVRAVVLRSSKENIFCAGANIFMLGSSSHAFKVNFCKFTNETRLAMEDASRYSGLRFLAACNGTTAGGGYELALACDEIVLVDDGNSSVSLPETPLLGVLPGTGGLTRLVDKRKVRRDRADYFCTVAEGIKGARAAEWGLVDAVVARSKFEDFVLERARELARSGTARDGPGIPLLPLNPQYSEDGVRFRHVSLNIDRPGRTATLLVRGPERGQPVERRAVHASGSHYWPLRTFLEIDRALLHLRFNEPEVGLILVKTQGDPEEVRRVDEFLAGHQDYWLVREIVLLMKRTLKRLDVTSRSIFSLIEPGSCFIGSLLELSLAADRSYILDDPETPVGIALTPMNEGLLPMGNGLTRLQTRFLKHPSQIGRLLGRRELIWGKEAEKLELVSFALDELDYEDDLRIAIEERTSLSPDALTGMESCLRFAGPETLETKIFGRLSSWQNWIFSRPNAVGEQGALTLYGKPERPAFDWVRT